MPRQYTMLIDQSGKIEEYDSHTGIASSHTSNDIEECISAIFIPQYMKQKLVGPSTKKLGSKKAFHLKLLSAGIYFVLEDYLPRIGKVVVDREYDNNGPRIKSHLHNFWLQHDGKPKSVLPQITFERVHSYGNPPRAHEIAYDVREGNQDAPSPDFEYLKGMILPSR
ncbi:MAG: hypothetical protein ABEJ62_00870 [Candidatus Nanohaloarchaea archaeon]